MAPAIVPVDFVVHSCQIQQELQLMPRQYQHLLLPLEHAVYSSNNFTGGDPLGTQPSLSASLALLVMLVLSLFCVSLG